MAQIQPNYSGLLGGIGLGQGLQQQMAGLQNAYNTQYYPLTDTTTYTTVTTGTSAASIDFQQYLAKFEGVVEKKSTAPRKTGKVLLDLRREIDDWHGDVLRAA